jgi:dolichol-phosphate mannosyltransferase
MNRTQQKLISIVVPFHNEAANLPLLIEALHHVTDTLPYDFEFVLIDDGSRDKSALAVREMARHDDQIHFLQFARNFSKEMAVSAGIHAAKGSAAIIMDADLQHPPELIPQFIEKWEKGAEIVVGVRKYDKRETWFKKTASAGFYRIMQRISHTQITPHATDFRLIDRAVIREFNRFTEHNRMTRGLIDWMGFRRDYIHFVAPMRIHGEAAYTLKKLVSLAMNSFTAYSLFPLKLAGYIGIGIVTITGPLGMFAFIEQFVLHDPLDLHIRGTAVLAILTAFLVGVMLIAIGLVALYIAHIHAEVTNRPLYILRRPEQGEN